MKQKLKILGISYSESQVGSYIIVLSEQNGKRKLPIITKPIDAQQIALKIEGVKNQRPSTHDIFKSLADVCQMSVVEVNIYSVIEGIFYTRIILSNGIEEVTIESSVSDGILLSLIYECDLYASEDVLKSSGIYINDDGSYIEDDDKYNKNDENTHVSIDDLEHMLKSAIENEEYEIAAELRDQINLRKN